MNLSSDLDTLSVLWAQRSTMVSGESMKFYEHLFQDPSAPSTALVEPLPQSFNLIWFLFLPQCGFYASIQYHTCKMSKHVETTHPIHTVWQLFCPLMCLSFSSTLNSSSETTPSLLTSALFHSWYRASSPQFLQTKCKPKTTCTTSVIDFQAGCLVQTLVGHSFLLQVRLG
jgi:hypothetical protein